MENMILAGIAVTVIGLLGLIYCIFKAFAARKSNLEGEEMTKYLQGLVAINVGSFFVSAIGLCLVIMGTIL